MKWLEKFAHWFADYKENSDSYAYWIHGLIAYGLMVTQHLLGVFGDWQFALLLLFIFGVLEFYFDKHWEHNPPQPFTANLKDWLSYLAGTIAGYGMIKAMEALRAWL